MSSPRSAALPLALVSAVCCAAGCVDRGAFVCTSNEACSNQGARGWCEPTGYCSFDDTNCVGGRGYGMYAAGTLAGQCVQGVATDAATRPGAEGGEPDAPPDGAPPPDGPPPPPDGRPPPPPADGPTPP